jgi:hypothetical protein
VSADTSKERTVTLEGLLNQYRLALMDAGEDIAVRRYAGSGSARGLTQEAIVRGRVIGLGAEDIVGDIKITDRKVILLNDPDAVVPAGKVALSALLPLRSSDTLAFRGREVAILSADDDTRLVAGAFEITVRG